MKALVCREWGHYSTLDLSDLPTPEPGPGQVRVDVHSASVGFGHIVIIAGNYQRKPPRPFTPGTELSGRISAVGAGVTHLAVGDPVAAALDWGAYGEQAITQADRTWKAPEGIDMAAAAAIPSAYGTTYSALHWRARIQPGETLVVYGAAGGLGLAAVQLGAMAGAHVIAVAGSDERVDIAKAHGAHEGLTHGGGDLGKRIKALNGGRGVDVVYDPVGGELSLEAVRCLRPEGRLLLIGFAGGGPALLPTNHLLVKNIDVIGHNFGHYLWGFGDEPAEQGPRMSAMMEELLADVASGRLVPPAGPRFPLERFVEAFDAVQERRSIGRVALVIAGR